MYHSSFDGFNITFTISLELILLLVLVFMILFLKSLYEWAKNDSFPLVTTNAKVIAKRTASLKKYYVTFQTENNYRTELKISDKKYGLLVEGDTGELTFQGNKCKEFKITI